MEPAGAAEFNKTLNQYVKKSWNNQNGLPQNTITSIAQTPDGYLWLGSLEGLLRFDGLNFTAFDTRTTDTFGHNMVASLFIDNKGVLWIGTSGGGLTRMEAGSFKNYSKNEGLPSNQINQILQDNRGELWVGTDGGGLVKYQSGKFISEGFTKAIGLSIKSIAEDRQGLWIASEKGLFYKPFDAPLVFLNLFSNNSSPLIQKLFLNTDSELLIGTNSGMYKLDSKNHLNIEKVSILSEQSILSIIQDRSKNLWVSTESNGLFRIQGDLNRPSKIESIMKGQSVNVVFEAAEKGIWIGTQLQGLTLLKDAFMTSYTDKEGLSNNLVRSVLEKSDGHILIGTEGGGVDSYADGIIRSLPESYGLSDRKIYAMLEDSEDVLWFGTDEGLIKIKYDVNSNSLVKRYTVDDGLLSNVVLDVLEDNLGNIWIGSYKGGLNKLPKQNKNNSNIENSIFESYSTNEGLVDSTVNIIMQDSQGALWIGTRGGGLNRFYNGEFTLYSTKNGLSDDLVFALHEDSSGSIWIGTYGGGISRLKEGKIVSITQKQGLFDNVIHRIIPDHLGQFWITSNRGIFSVSKKSLDEVADGLRERVNSFAYGVADGMKNSECNGGSNAGILASNGKMWFPTAHGVVSFTPKPRESDFLSSRLLVERVMLNGESVSLNSINRLPPDIDSLQFNYTTTNLSQAEKIYFKYRLEGVEDKWTYAGTRREAYYSNLAAGTYHFRLMATYNGDPWVNDGISLKFTILPYYYETLWFKILALFLFLAFIFVVYRFRVNQLEKNNLRLENLVDERTKQLQQANNLLEQMAREDGLTGILNRRAFDEILQQECRRTERNQTAINLLLIDIDYFKQYNDTLGHPAGDACIQAVANVLEQHFNRAGEFVARYGGDEFAVVLPSIDKDKAIKQAEKICQSVSKLTLANPQSEISSFVTVTIGIGHMNKCEKCSPSELLSIADKALYVAKKKGRNRVFAESIE